MKIIPHHSIILDNESLEELVVPEGTQDWEEVSVNTQATHNERKRSSLIFKVTVQHMQLYRMYVQSVYYMYCIIVLLQKC